MWRLFSRIIWFPWRLNFTNHHDIKSYALIQIGIYIILTGLQRPGELGRCLYRSMMLYTTSIISHSSDHRLICDYGRTIVKDQVNVPSMIYGFPAVMEQSVNQWARTAFISAEADLGLQVTSTAADVSQRPILIAGNNVTLRKDNNLQEPQRIMHQLRP